MSIKITCPCCYADIEISTSVKAKARRNPVMIRYDDKDPAYDAVRNKLFLAIKGHGGTITLGVLLNKLKNFPRDVAIDCIADMVSKGMISEDMKENSTGPSKVKTYTLTLPS
jgi:hypothetical protein